MVSSKQIAGRTVAVGVIGVLSVAVGGLGIATAANGGSLVLGHHNTATSTTTLKDSRGTPLSLVGKHSKPPLSVNSSKQVKHLNASLVGGKSASQLATAGSAGSIPPGTDLSLTSGGNVLSAQTGTLSPGTYYVQASALADGTDGGFCYIGTSSNSSTALQWGGVEPATSFWQAGESIAVHLAHSTSLGEYCESENSTGDVYDAGITAISIAHSSGHVVSAVRHATPATRPGH